MTGYAEGHEHAWRALSVIDHRPTIDRASGEPVDTGRFERRSRCDECAATLHEESRTCAEGPAADSLQHEWKLLSGSGRCHWQDLTWRCVNCNAELREQPQLSAEQLREHARPDECPTCLALVGRPT